MVVQTQSWYGPPKFAISFTTEDEHFTIEGSFVKKMQDKIDLEKFVDVQFAKNAGAK